MAINVELKKDSDILLIELPASRTGAKTFVGFSVSNELND